MWLLYETKNNSSGGKVSDRQMVNDSVEFFNKDARDVFLEPSSVDLFLIHPPYFKMPEKVQYGGDQNLQIHKLTEEEFSRSMIAYLNNMSDALKDDGNILLIIPNSHDGILGIGDIIKNTNLSIEKILFWHFGKIEQSDKYNYMSNLILQIRKNKENKDEIKGLDILIIDQEWVLSDVLKYQNMGLVGDAFPTEIADIFINAFSKEGDVVADIFGGTGTTAISALKNNRKAIYNDVSIDQFNLAKKRVYDTIRYNTDNERQDNMTKEDALTIMLESINSDNFALGIQAGLSEEDMKTQIAQSQQSLNFMMSNIYDKLKDAGAIA